MQPAPPEGALLPETYQIERGEDRAAVLQRMMDAHDEVLALLWSKRQPGLPVQSPQEAVILASVVEKETAVASERPQVASVFVNRLRRGMRLESDPTIIYGLTKGQYSPTSEQGKKTKSTPMGSVDHPMSPVNLALGAGATFIGRSIDTFGAHLEDVIMKAAAHEGTALVEIYQNCNIFNDKAFESVVHRKVRGDRCVFVENGKPMTFGTPEAPKGLRMVGTKVEIVELGDGGYTEDDLLVHDTSDRILAGILVQLDYPDFPVPMGVIYQEERPTYNDGFQAQLDLAKAQTDDVSLESLFRQGPTWEVE